ncbi:LytR/AlgR family response regulator transcription factor [Chryseobacterium paridis]|uniref:Response regulator transcription factor n=1 Tax=Chryseobacterium paridis TaxID=2800328 RepID=A0ABS1FUY1_9FLAO|nr:LytTR family DNA-binding domain-containing protein [Chryseobacterium paridis]MBK1896217.1 response regulator transcription factor [Chryseobacterium paridis]
MKCIVIDDEPVARMGMEDLIMDSPGLTFLRAFNSTIGVEEYLKTHEVDIIFLDIEMPVRSGIEFAPLVPPETLLVFTTAYPHYAIESYELDAMDYLLKPISQERFNKTVSKAASYLALLKNDKYSIENTSDDHIIVRADKRFHKLFYNNITHIEALKDYVIIYTADEKRHITWMNLKNMYLKLPQDQFIRISRSHIVNNRFVTSFDNTTVWIKEIEITLGKSFRDDFFAKHSL